MGVNLDVQGEYGDHYTEWNGFGVFTVYSQDRARGMASLNRGIRMGKICSSKDLLSWSTDSNSATVGDADASPTPTPRSVLGPDY